MSLSAVPDLLSFTRLNRRTAALKERLEITSTEVVTGRFEDLTKATGGQLGSAHLLNKAIQDIDNRAELFKVTQTRMTLMGETLEGTRKTLDNMGTRAITVLTSNSNTGVSTLIEEAEASLRTVFTALQLNYGTRNLFSGDATSTQPLGDVNQLLIDVRAIVSAGPDVSTIEAALDTYFEDPTGTFQTTIYQGGQGNSTSVLLANDTRVDFTIRADDPSLKRVMRGLATIAAADLLPFDRFSEEFGELFAAASFQLNNGEAGVVELESKLGIGLQLISNSEDIQAAEKLTLTAAYSEITGRDQFEASTDLKQLETQLETSYLLTARLSQLTLTNFIR